MHAIPFLITKQQSKLFMCLCVGVGKEEWGLLHPYNHTQRTLGFVLFSRLFSLSLSPSLPSPPPPSLSLSLSLPPSLLLIFSESSWYVRHIEQCHILLSHLKREVEMIRCMASTILTSLCMLETIALHALFVVGRFISFFFKDIFQTRQFKSTPGPTFLIWVQMVCKD